MLLCIILYFNYTQTSHTTSFLLYFLAKNAEKQDKLRKEIVSVVGPKGSAVTAEALNELRYLKACIKESLRLVCQRCNVFKFPKFENYY